MTVVPRTLRVAVVYPDLLGTYGDGGNGLVLAGRARWRGIGVELLQAESGRPLPDADLYCLGGGEDGPQVQAADALRDDGTLHRAVQRGAVVFGVCAGFQLLGTSFPDRTGQARDGLGLLDVTTTKGTGPRAVGELMAVPVAGAPTLPPDGRALPALTGFENHGGVTAVGAGATPLATVVTGVGNGAGDRTEGAWSGRVVGTYLHGPVLARNTGLADLLLWWTLESVGADGPWPELDDHLESALRHQRLEAAQRRASGGLARRLRRV